VILAVSPTIDEESMAYLESRKVTVVKVQYVPCTHGLFNETKQAQAEHEEELTTCVAPYDKLKARWGRFPFLRDLLQKCSTCTGPVLITDVRDTYFQIDPFGSNQSQVQGLQVFQEHVRMTTQHWLVEWPVRECKNVSFHEPMLCSGTIIGTRHAMLEDLDEMEREMNAWITDRKWHFEPMEMTNLFTIIYTKLAGYQMLRRFQMDWALSIQLVSKRLSFSKHIKHE
jgi:hypothetical protein